MTAKNQSTTTVFRKVVMFPLVRTVIALVMVVAAASISQALLGALGMVLFGSDTLPAFWTLFTAFIVVTVGLVAYYLYVRYVEQREPTELATEGAWQEVGLGVVIGFGLFTATILILWLLGYYRVDGINGAGALVLPFTMALFAGVIEELIFRGIVFRIIEEYMGSWWALFMSALFFGFAHASNPNATMFSNIAIALEAGILLGAAYMFTRRLWLVIGIHFAWNFIQGGIFGVAVSGTDQQGLLQGHLDGPELWSGGQFGAEASIFAVIICLMMGGYFIFKAQQSKQVVAPMWAKTT